MYRLLLLVCILALGAGTALAQELEAPDPFWLSRERQRPAAAAELVLARNPLTTGLLFLHAKRSLIWKEPELPTDRAPALNQDWLDEIVDKTDMPRLSAKTKQDDPAGWAFFLALKEALIYANQIPIEAFAASAKEREHVTTGHLLDEPAKYRGKVIPVHGTLKRVRKKDTPEYLQAEGIPFVYEGWLFGSTRGANPIKIVFLSLPEGLKEAEDMKADVDFYGYFLKVIRYEDAKEKHRLTPYLVGPSVAVRKLPLPADKEEDTPVSAKAIMAVCGVIAAAVAFMFGVSWYYRRGDQRLRDKISALQAERTMEMIDRESLGDSGINSEDLPQPPPQNDVANGH